MDVTRRNLIQILGIAPAAAAAQTQGEHAHAAPPAPALAKQAYQRLLDVAGDLKRKFKGRVPHRYLADQTIFLMFFDKSTRTRNSFEAGMTQLGGHAHFLTADVMQVSHGESPKDTGIILSSYGHAI